MTLSTVLLDLEIYDGVLKVGIGVVQVESCFKVLSCEEKIGKERRP